MASARGSSGLSKGRSSGLASIGVVLLVVLGVWLSNGRDPGSSTGQTSSSASSSGGTTSVVQLADLPREAKDTVALIDSGGPYPYEEDGSIFGNYEALLPTEPHGYYQEFTVDTPGSSDRGARRLIVGQDHELYWTADHYVSFARVRR